MYCVHQNAPRTFKLVLKDKSACRRSHLYVICMFLMYKELVLSYLLIEIVWHITQLHHRTYINTQYLYICQTDRDIIAGQTLQSG